MSVVGEPKNYDQKWNFAVEIDNIEVAWFQSISGLEFEIGVIEQAEGGNILAAASQDAGKIKFSPITLMNGVTNNRDLLDWALEGADASANAGLPKEGYKRTAAIVQKDRDGSEKRRYNLFKAWISKYKAGEWDAKADENVIEETTITYLYFERVDAVSA